MIMTISLSAFPESQCREIERLLAAWRTESPKFAKVDLHKKKESDQDKIEKQASSVLRLIKASKFLKLGFDPYQHCDVKPLEKNTRDFMLAIFNSDYLRHLGRKVFLLILREATRVRNGYYRGPLIGVPEI